MRAATVLLITRRSAQLQYDPADNLMNQRMPINQSINQSIYSATAGLPYSPPGYETEGHHREDPVPEAGEANTPGARLNK